MRLIDADELKKDIMAYKTMPEIRKAICEVIDDAPTVEPEKVYLAKFSFDEDKLEQIVRDEVIEPIKKGELVLRTDERPQGKWEEDWQEDLDFMSRKGWKCPFCKWRTTYGATNFCMKCGADLRGEDHV